MSGLYVVLALLLLFVGVTFLVRTGRARASERVCCPADGKEHTAVVERRLGARWERARAVDVVACDVFEQPEQVTCAKACLQTAARRGPA